MRVHLVTDVLVGLFLATSPWIFGFADQGVNAWLPFLLIGLGELVAAATTDPDRSARSARRGQAHTA